MIRKSGNRFSEMIVLKDQLAVSSFKFNSKSASYKATETVCMSNNGKRVAWVTGGGSGIGEGPAGAMAAGGWIVVASGRCKDAMVHVVARSRKKGRKAEALAHETTPKAN